MKYLRQFTDKKTGETFEVEVDIDLDTLAQELAARAYYSKGKKSQLKGGAVKCRVTDTVFFSEPPDRPDSED